MSSTVNRFSLHSIVFAASLVLTVAVYWVGLRGPFIFDDNVALGAVQAWHQGKADLQQVMMGNTSWATHRSISMGSLALNAWAFGFNAHSLKLGNLILHLLVGVAGLLALSAMLRRDASLARHYRLVAMFIAAIWLLHPLNVSTVLYVVQRMAQMATLFCLLGLWLYVVLRSRIEQGNMRAWTWLFLGIPLLTALGIQGKQNAAVLPALCLIVELAYFRSPRAWPRALVAFFGLFLVLPLALAGLGVLIHPETLLNGYGEYEFTPAQRLLSQARVLSSYLQMLLAPNTPSMGLYTDDYTASSGLLSPPSTLLAILFLLTTSIGAWMVRKSLPSVFAGWFFYLVAHAVEGTILPLELYYEHRNYLPAFGIFLACAGIITATFQNLKRMGVRVGRIGAVTSFCVLAVLAVQTHGRARVWSNGYVLVESAFRNHPNSARAAITYMGMAMDAGNIPLAKLAARDIIRTSTSSRVRGLTLLFSIRLACAETGKATADTLGEALRVLPEHIDLTTALTFGYVRAGLRGDKCTGISALQLADAMVQAAERATHQPNNAWPKLYLRHGAAKLYAGEGDWQRALTQARLAWQPTIEPSAATVLVEALLANGCRSEAASVYRDALKRARPHSEADRIGLKEIERILAEEEHHTRAQLSASCESESDTSI